MCLSLFYSLFTILTTFIVSFILISVTIAIYVKLKYEPFKAICTSNAKLDGKIVLITGGNQGIGLETARGLAARGAKVIIACRDEQKSAEAIADIIKNTGSADVQYKYLDLSKFKCIRKFAEEFNHIYDRLDILINNAGCAAMTHKTTEDGIDLVMQVNFLGPFLLTNLLLDKIKASPAGRIIILSSILYILGRITPKELNGLDKYSLLTYCHSKLCSMLWTRALARRLPRNVTVNCVHPGYVKTDIFNHLGRFLGNWCKLMIDLFNFKTPEEGAQTPIYLAVSEEVADVSGKYFYECKEAKYTSTVYNEELVEKIWEKSVEMTNKNL